MADSLVQERERILPQALGGWNISSIYTVRTGIPFSIYDVTYLLNYTSYSAPDAFDAHYKLQRRDAGTGQARISSPG